MMLTKTFLVFDHVRHKIQVVSHAHLDADVEGAYKEAVDRIDSVVDRLNKPLNPTSIPRSSDYPSKKISSNMSPDDHRFMVDKSKDYVVEGDVIQVVVSQRFSRPSSAHPFPVSYTHLRAHET